MTNKEFAEKYKVSLQIAKRIRHKKPMNKTVNTFYIYDIADKNDPEFLRMNQFLKENHRNYQSI